MFRCQWTLPGESMLHERCIIGSLILIRNRDVITLHGHKTENQVPGKVLSKQQPLEGEALRVVKEKPSRFPVGAERVLAPSRSSQPALLGLSRPVFRMCLRSVSSAMQGAQN